MGAKKKIKLGDVEVEVERVTMVSAHEPWCEYVIEDGTTVKVKVVSHAAWRSVSYRGPDGAPMYLIEFKTVIAEEVPDALKSPRAAPGGAIGGANLV